MPDRRSFLTALALVLALAATPFVRADEPRDEARFVILHTNDMHGAVYPQETRAADGKVTARHGGVPAVIAYVAEARAEARRTGATVLLLDAGDLFQGTPEGDLPQGRLLLHLLNLAGYDAMAPGNHDFDQGPAVTEALARRARFPFLAANVFRAGTERVRPDWLRPWMLVEAQGLRLALVGLTTSEMPLVTVPRARVGLEFADEMTTLLDVLPRLDVEQQPDLKILVTHCGVEKDAEVAQAIPGITLIVGGHSHTTLDRGWVAPGTGTLVVQTGSSARSIGRVDLVVDRGTRKVKSIEARLVALDLEQRPEDPSARALIAGFASGIDEEMNAPVGAATGPILRHAAGGSSPLGNLLADRIREATGAQIAFHNRGGIRADLPPGPLRLRDMYKVSPFGNTLVTMELTGADVIALLETAVSVRFLEVSGLTARYDPAAPPGSRIRKAVLAADGVENPIDPAATYRVATNNFLAAGGDGHAAFTRGKNLHDTGIPLLDVQVEWFRKNSPVTAPEDARLAPQ